MSLSIQNNSRRQAYSSLAAVRLISGITAYEGEVINLSGHTTEGDGGGGDFYWDDSSTATDNNGTIVKLADTTTGRFIRVDQTRISVRMFGAKGNGSTDDTTALQAALDTNAVVYLPSGKYKITSALIIDPARNRNCGFTSDASWSAYPYTAQTGSVAWDGTKEAIIFYDGSADATLAIIQASAEAVGTEPDSLFSNNIYGLRMENVLLDGNAKAGFGFYGIRMVNPQITNCSVRGTTKHAWYINGNYSGSFNSITACFNSGCGISIGRAKIDYGWTTNNKINATTFNDLHAFANGSDKAFNETSNPIWGYGVGMWLHRGNNVGSVISEVNDGVGTYWSPSSGSNIIESGYTELNNVWASGGAGTDAISEGRATRQWGIWFEGQSGGVSLGNVFSNIFIAAEGIKLLGTEPSSGRPEGGVEFQNVTGANYLTSAWANFRLINCNSELINALNGTAPTGSQQFIGGIQVGNNSAKMMEYNEVSFTPTVIGSSASGAQGYAVQVGKWTKIGNMMHINGYVVVSSTDGNATGLLRIGGLPEPAVTLGNYFAVSAISYWFGISSIVSGGIIASGTDYIDINASASGATTTINATTISSSTRFRFNASYQLS